MSGLSKKLPFGRFILLFATWTALVYLCFPFMVIVPLSFTSGDYLSFPPPGFSLRWYQHFIDTPKWYASGLQSILIGVASAILASFFGTLSSLGMWRANWKHGAALQNLLLLPLIVPPIISAVVMFRLWSRWHIVDTLFGLVLAHTILGLPYVVITVNASLANFDIKLEQAARSLGAGHWYVLRRVTVPCILPGILSGALFAFVTSWDESVVALFLCGIHTSTLPRAMWDGIKYDFDPTVSVIATMLFAITSVVLLMFVARRR
jgi:putative spermidine/putrescine transport system permease protein